MPQQYTVGLGVGFPPSLFNHTTQGAIMYSVKNVKTWNSQEYGPNGAYSCTLYRDKKRVAKFTEWGDGAPPKVEWLDRGKGKTTLTLTNRQGNSYERQVSAEEQKFFNFIKGKTWDVFGKNIDHDDESYIPLLVAEHDKARAERLWENKLKRWCKVKTVAIMKDAKDGEITCWNAPFTPSFRKAVMKRYGDEIVEFVNERYA
jgi:hypothetical protein